MELGRGAFASLWLTGRPMGFLAILGITSLIGVIVSHVIVLFDSSRSSASWARRCGTP